MNKFERITEVFEREMPHVGTELVYGSPFQLLVAVILSAQCTDKRINMVTPALFASYPTAEALSRADFEDVFELVRSVSYPRNKARHIIDMAKRLQESFGGILPSTLDELLTLPGVGRKTANVIMSVVFGKSTMAVDTHVFRVSHRLGLVPATANTPYAVEQVLTRGFAEGLIPKAHHWLLLHGRYVCTARAPKCEACFLQKMCEHYLHSETI